ncbi:hypothetical protein PGT21_011173 [Puccinia graminis f. sp. tritici]|uniref:Chitin-binding type-2 domain-containing protein n=1 Tax=Puccinia graminis f. sp. tritici TaxID=56615 RepID=A0A5B0Q2M1_PUCGR|nr:hypothetical protein PGT21_011173 [Puccinia graminis f. sp. tritici]
MMLAFKPTFLFAVTCLLSAPMVNGSPGMEPAGSVCTHLIRRPVYGDFPCQATYNCHSGYEHQCGHLLAGEAQQCGNCKDVFSIRAWVTCPYGNHPVRPCAYHDQQVGTRRKRGDQD